MARTSLRLGVCLLLLRASLPQHAATTTPRTRPRPRPLPAVATASGSSSSSPSASTSPDTGGPSDDTRRPRAAAATPLAGSRSRRRARTRSTSIASGETIKIGLSNDEGGAFSLPEFRVGAEVGAKYINDHGGINGAKIELVNCLSDASPEGAVNCANQFVEAKVDMATYGIEVAIDAVAARLQRGRHPADHASGLREQAAHRPERHDHRLGSRRLRGLAPARRSRTSAPPTSPSSPRTSRHR